MVEGSVTRPTETMTERETMEALTDNLKKAASCFRELAKEFHNEEWNICAHTAEMFSVNCVKLANMKAMNKFETAMALNLKSNPKGLLN